MNDNTVALAAIALASSLSIGFFALINKLSKSLDDVVESNKSIAKATHNVGVEAQLRNGHLADLVIATTKSVNDLAEKNLIDYKKDNP